MILTELINDISTAYDDPSQDQAKPKLGDLRKTKLTLKQIQRLRMISDVRRAEKEKRLTTVKKQYGAPAAPQQ